MTLKTILRSMSFVLAASVASFSFAQSASTDSTISANPNVGNSSTSNNPSANASGTPSTLTSSGNDQAGAASTGSVSDKPATEHSGMHKKHTKSKMKKDESGMDNPTGNKDTAVKQDNKNATKQ